MNAFVPGSQTWQGASSAVWQRASTSIVIYRGWSSNASRAQKCKLRLVFCSIAQYRTVYFNSGSRRWLKFILLRRMYRVQLRRAIVFCCLSSKKSLSYLFWYWRINGLNRRLRKVFLMKWEGEFYESFPMAISDYQKA